MKAVGKYIVIEEVNEELKTDYGLLLGEDDKKDMRYAHGRVVSPGTEVRCVEAGVEVYYDKAHAFTINVKGKWLTIIREQDLVLCV